jgi:hypothetical protein
MQFSELKEQIKTVEFETLRFDIDNYFEAVLVRATLEKLNSVLEKTLGLAVWPSKKCLTDEIEKAIASFGGIRGDQMLYFLSDANGIIFAMLWPWGDGNHITLKLVKK